MSCWIAGARASAARAPGDRGRLRSPGRQGARPRARTLALAMLLGVAVLGVTSPELGEERAPLEQVRADGIAARSPAAVPSVASMRAAWRFARRRGGQVSLAVVDTRGRLRGRDAGRRYVSASVVKAMLLVAELRRLRRDGLPLDGTTSDLLGGMIVTSDNDSADAVYARLGDAGLLEVAKLARMRSFTVAGHWANAQVTAADLARLFSRMRGLLPRRHRRFALDLLASVVREQRWGLPRAAGSRWRTHFKGGWRETGSGQLVHQAAWLHRGDRELAIAVLTDAQPSRLYGIHTVRGIADRLLR